MGGHNKPERGKDAEDERYRISACLFSRRVRPQKGGSLEAWEKYLFKRKKQHEREKTERKVGISEKLTKRGKRGAECPRKHAVRSLQ